MIGSSWPTTPSSSSIRATQPGTSKVVAITSLPHEEHAAPARSNANSIESDSLAGHHRQRAAAVPGAFSSADCPGNAGGEAVDGGHARGGGPALGVCAAGGN